MTLSKSRYRNGIRCPKILWMDAHKSTETGSSKSTIGNQLRWGSKQSKSIVVDTRHTTLTYEEIEKRVKNDVINKSSIKRVILIDKFGKIVEIRK